MILHYKPLQNQPYFIALGGVQNLICFRQSQTIRQHPTLTKKKKHNFQFTVNAETKKEASKI